MWDCLSLARSWSPVCSVLCLIRGHVLKYFPTLSAWLVIVRVDLRASCQRKLIFVIHHNRGELMCVWVCLIKTLNMTHQTLKKLIITDLKLKAIKGVSCLFPFSSFLPQRDLFPLSLILTFISILNSVRVCVCYICQLSFVSLWKRHKKGNGKRLTGFWVKTDIQLRCHSQSAWPKARERDAKTTQSVTESHFGCDYWPHVNMLWMLCFLNFHIKSTTLGPEYALWLMEQIKHAKWNSNNLCSH